MDVFSQTRCRVVGVQSRHGHPLLLKRNPDPLPSFPLFYRATSSGFFHTTKLVRSVFSYRAQLPRARTKVGGDLEHLLEVEPKPISDQLDFHGLDHDLVQKMVHDALVWCSLHGLVVGDRNSQRSGKVPGVGMVHAPTALLPMSFPESHWKQACDLAPIFNELVDRVSLDGEFLQKSLSRAKKVDDFTSRLLDIHSKILEMNKKEEIRLGLHRSDYMLDEQTKLLLQTELNTISTSSHSTGSLVNKLHRCLLDDYGHQLGLHSHRIPVSSCISQFAQALAKAWDEYNQPNAVIMVVVQTEERNMYDQHWLLHVLKERYPLKLSIFVLKSAADIFKHGDDIAHSSFLSLLTHIMSKLYAKRWQKLTEKREFYQMER